MHKSKLLRRIKGIFLSEIKSWDQKKSVMHNKNKLKGTKIYIENDMTVEERTTKKILCKQQKLKTKK